MRSLYQYIGTFPYILANFDGIHYMDIAQRGYITEAAFFPLYPYLIKLNPFWMGLLISNLSLVLAIYFLSKLLSLDYSKQTVFWVITFLLVFPTSFYFYAVYSESLFLFLTILTFYLARRGRWGWGLICATLLSATRFVGIFIIFGLMAEYFIQKKPLKGLWLMLVPAISTVGYAIFNYLKWGDWLYFLHAHGQLGNGRSTTSIVLPFQTLYRYAKILMTVSFAAFEWKIAFLELSVFVLGCILLYVGWKQKIRRSYLAFSALCFFLPAFSGTFSGLPRYFIVCFSFFISMGMLKSKLAKILLASVFAILQVVLLSYFAKGYFIA